MHTTAGIVPNVVRELFAEIENTAAANQQAGDPPKFRQYSLRLSMMEIYNEVSHLSPCDMQGIRLFFFLSSSVLLLS